MVIPLSRSGQRWLVLGAVLLGGTVALVSALTAHGESVCSTGEIGRVGYARAVDVYTGTSLADVRCEGERAVLSAGSAPATRYAVYRYGYKKGARGWERFALSGTRGVGDWFMGSATAEVSFPNTAKNLDMLVYVCALERGGWRCGCGDTACARPMWQGLRTTRATPEAAEEPKREDPVQEAAAGSDGAMYVYFPSTYAAPAGTEVVLTGEGFPTRGLEVLMNEKAVATDLSSTGSTLTFSLPDLAPGKYDVAVRAGRRTSEDATVIWITQAGAAKPVATRLTPERGHQGDEVTLHGTGFLPTGNEVVTSLGVVSDITSPDGTTLSFTLDPFEEDVVFVDEQGEKREGIETPVYLRVANTSGISEPVLFTLTY